MGHCLRVDLTLGFIFVWFGLFCRVSIVWLSERGGGGPGGGGIAGFGISSEVCRTDLVWKKLITQGPKGV